MFDTDGQHTVLSVLRAKGGAWLDHPRTPKSILLEHCIKCKEDLACFDKARDKL